MLKSMNIVRVRIGKMPMEKEFGSWSLHCCTVLCIITTIGDDVLVVFIQTKKKLDIACESSAQ